MNESVFKTFGKRLVSSVRDYSISPIRLRLMRTDDLGTEEEKNERKCFQNLDQHSKDFCFNLITLATDSAINNFLWLLENERDWIKLVISDDNSWGDITQMGDGICGDYWSWVDEFSDFERPK